MIYYSFRLAWSSTLALHNITGEIAIVNISNSNKGFVRLDHVCYPARTSSLVYLLGLADSYELVSISNPGMLDNVSYPARTSIKEVVKVDDC